MVGRHTSSRSVASPSFVQLQSVVVTGVSEFVGIVARGLSSIIFDAKSTIMTTIGVRMAM